jgi:hypothetical protein
VGIFDQVEVSLDNFQQKKLKTDPYFFFEPWDCDIPDPDVMRSALADGVDLVEDPAVKLAGEYPRQFQTGSILSEKKMVVTQAGSRSGKSICTQVVIAAMVSRQPPYAFRYDKGVDTGIKREINAGNINRFGRIDKETGNVLDHNSKKKEDGTWDCGTIKGVGKFPEELYAPAGSQIWIGTIAKSITSFWWPSFTGTGEARFFPQEFIDTSKGNKGSNWQQQVIHCINDIDILIKTYEQGHTKFESQTAWLLAYDEEPTKKEIYLSGALHATYQRFSFTPLNGKTWSEGVFFSCLEKHRKAEEGLRRSDFDYFYASQFDSPYVPREKLERDRRAMELWERRARVWGQYSEFEGMPFFNRSKIQRWTNRFSKEYRVANFKARGAYSGLYGSKVSNKPGLMQIRIDAETAEKENGQDTWRIYENVRKGVGYLGVFDAAEGATNPDDVQDKSFGAFFRLPLPDEVTLDGLPVLVATCRSTLPTVAFARTCFPALRYYNNAVLAAERGHGKDNEAFGMTLEEWPFWYYYESRNAATKALRPKKGFDTNAHTRTAMFLKLRDWMDFFEADQDPHIYDKWIFSELAGAIIKETPGGKRRCDHPRDGSLDGVICLGIGTYIVQETPEVVVCNQEEEKEKGGGFMQRMQAPVQSEKKHIPMGSGIARVGERA